MTCDPVTSFIATLFWFLNFFTFIYLIADGVHVDDGKVCARGPINTVS